MISTIYDGSELSNTPLEKQINLPIGLQAFKLDFRHNSSNADGGLTLSYWGEILNEDINGLAPPKVGITTIVTGVIAESKIISISFGVPVNVVKFSAFSAGNRKLFLAVVAEQDYGM